MVFSIASSAGADGSACCGSGCLFPQSMQKIASSSMGAPQNAQQGEAGGLLSCVGTVTASSRLECSAAVSGAFCLAPHITQNKDPSSIFRPHSLQYIFAYLSVSK